MTGRVEAILLAAGGGIGQAPGADDTPACLRPIGGRPLLDLWVDRLLAAGVAGARVLARPGAGSLRAHIEAGQPEGRMPLAEWAGPSSPSVDADALILIDVDQFSDVDLSRMLDFHRGHGGPITTLVVRHSQPSAAGVDGGLVPGRVLIVDPDAYRTMVETPGGEPGLEVPQGLLGRAREWVWEGYHRPVRSPGDLDTARRDAPRLATVAVGRRPAVFLDRDGTIIEHVHYLRDPKDVRLIPGAADALRRLGEAGYVRVVVTNQSAIARGMLTVEGLAEVHEVMNRQLADEGAAVEAIYFCAEAPSGDDRTVVEHGDRKPGPGMLIRAAGDLGLDLAASWMVGDMISDVLAGRNAGCRGNILVRTGQESARSEAALSAGDLAADDLPAAADLILASDRPS